MGLFEKLGRRVGQFEQEAKAAAEEHGTVECGVCGARVDVEAETCPECGADLGGSDAE
jgi:ribosomal protein L40E